MTNRQWLLEQMQNMSDDEMSRMFRDCSLCEFVEFESDCGDKCKFETSQWLKAEHKENPKLPKLSYAERVILENIDTVFNWIARDEDGRLHVYMQEPYKVFNNDNYWAVQRAEDERFLMLPFKTSLFQFIKWEDKEPYNIEELLKESEKENANKYLTIEKIKALYEEMDNNREVGDSYFTKYDGTQIPLDTGYAFEGIKLFIEEIEHKLKGE